MRQLNQADRITQLLGHPARSRAVLDPSTNPAQGPCANAPRAKASPIIQKKSLFEDTLTIDEKRDGKWIVSLFD